jgi:hypothetical protein
VPHDPEEDLVLEAAEAVAATAAASVRPHRRCVLRGHFVERVTCNCTPEGMNTFRSRNKNRRAGKKSRTAGPARNQERRAERGSWRPVGTDSHPRTRRARKRNSHAIQQSGGRRTNPRDWLGLAGSIDRRAGSCWLAASLPAGA